MCCDASLHKCVRTLQPLMATFNCYILTCTLTFSPNLQILLPRPVETQVNTAVLDLGNYSTTAIDLPTADSTLVLKVQ